MNLILNVYNPSELDGFGYAFVELTPELAALILKRRDAFKAVPADDSSPLLSMEYRDYSADFLCGLPDETAAPECDAGGDFDVTELDAATFEPYRESTECNRMVITEDSVYWTAYPKHCDRALTVETNQIDYKTVEQAAAERVQP